MALRYKGQCVAICSGVILPPTNYTSRPGRASNAYKGLELLLSHKEDGILLRLSGSADSGVVKDKGPTLYSQVSHAIAADDAQRTMHRMQRKGTDSTHMVVVMVLKGGEAVIVINENLHLLGVDR